jgi:hypothetical protein
MKRLVLCMLSVCAFACQPAGTTPLSEVVIQIDADELVQQAGDTLYVEIASGPSRNKLETSDPEEFDLTDPSFSWPVTITLVAKPSHETHVFELNLRLEKAGEVLARGRVQSGFAKGKTLVLQKSLGAECLGMLDCPDNETCVVESGRATCKSAAVDPGDLPTEIPMRDAGTPPSDAGARDDAGRSSDAGPGTTQDAATSDAGFDASGCIATGPEDCMNGLDDDCNGAADCADSACEPVTQCVPESLAYVLVGSEEACPAGYWELDIVHQDLKDNGCEGCSCTPLDKECEAYVSVYTSLLSCQRDSTNTGGTMLSNPATSSCSAPIGKATVFADGGFGFNVNVKAGKSACEASGDPKLSTPEWGAVYKRCSAELHPGGCVLGYCAPRPEAKEVCWAETETGCGTLVAAQAYFQGYDDTRACEACSCSTKGGSCSDVGATLTTDTSCRANGTVLRDGQKSCDAVSSEAMVRVTGKPSNPECSSQSVVSGALVATGQVNLCCGGALLSP